MGSQGKNEATLFQNSEENWFLTYNSNSDKLSVKHENRIKMFSDLHISTMKYKVGSRVHTA